MRRAAYHFIVARAAIIAISEVQKETITELPRAAHRQLQRVDHFFSSPSFFHRSECFQKHSDFPSFFPARPIDSCAFIEIIAGFASAATPIRRRSGCSGRSSCFSPRCFCFALLLLRLHLLFGFAGAGREIDSASGKGGWPRAAPPRWRCAPGPDHGVVVGPLRQSRQDPVSFQSSAFGTSGPDAG